MTPVFKAHCSSGKLVFENRSALDHYIHNLKDGPLEVIIRKVRVQRSSSQNAYYWSVIIPLIAEWSGHENEEVHLALRHRFLTDRTEAGLEFARSTSTLDTAEFTKYIELCRRFAAENGVYVPDPGEVSA